MHRKNRRPLNAMEISEEVSHLIALLHLLSMAFFIAVYLLNQYTFQLETVCEDEGLGHCEGVDLNRY